MDEAPQVNVADSEDVWCVLNKSKNRASYWLLWPFCVFLRKLIHPNIHFSMSKKILLCLALAFSALTASAQFEGGKVYLNTSLSGLGLSYSRNEDVHLDIRALGGYFLSNNCMVYAGVDFAHQPHWNQVSVDFGGRYYLESIGIYLSAGVKYAHSEEITAPGKFDNFFFVPEVGYAFFVNQYVTIEPAVYYNMSFNDFSDSSKVGLRIGVGFYF